MKDFNFGRWNKILGWVVFLIALITYGLTVQPTASFWDPGEFIAVSDKLQVGHPPGAPLFQMLGAFAAMFAIGKAHIALMINMISVLASAFTVAFLFWSISLLVRKISGQAETLGTGAKIAVLGSALVGSLAYSFTDSFWFSAVEAEVYASAMFFMSALFYVGLLWERDMFKPGHGNRWLILLALLTGLTFGIHFLGLLVIPAIGYLYYFKHTEKVTVKNFILSSIVIVGVLIGIFFILIPLLLTFFADAELFFVNTVRLPFGSGSIIAALVLIAAFYFGMRYTRKKNLPKTYNTLLCILFIIIGFSSWVMLPIRANAKTVINENNPENARALLAYYNREQYPQHALFYGPQFTNIFAGLNEKNPYVDGTPVYEENHKTGKYEVVNNWKKAKQNAPDDQKAFLPRMWSTQDNHITNYMNITGPVKFHLKPKDAGNEKLRRLVQQVKNGYAKGRIDNQGLTRFFHQYRRHLVVEKPSSSANLSFLFSYQFGYMYFRYFLWNFVGRQNDQQGELTDLKGNWLSGIPFIDNLHIGSQKDLPDVVKNDPSRATYFFLPLILGLIGLFFQLDRDKRSFWVIMVFFLFTGLILTFYLNERPFEPRERDYARVGSFLAFAVWIGIGVYALFDRFKKYLTPKILAPIVTTVCLLAVPVLMAQQNWPFHNRSGNYTPTAMAKNYLDSVGKNGILFTVGDNDTFPLWYVQEVEGYRTDVKIINTSLFATAWYIDQVKRQVYQRDSLHTILQHKNYTFGTNDVVLYQHDTRMPDTMTVKNWLRYIKSDNRSTKGQLPNDHSINLFPTKQLRLKVNKKNAIESGIVDRKDADKIVSSIPINIKSNQIQKNTLLMFDVIANLDWKRPVYFSGGSFDPSQYLWMKDYLELDGVCYKLVPLKTKSKGFQSLGRVEPNKMYKKVMNWHWGGSGTTISYYDPQTRRNSITYRSHMSRLAKALIAKGEPDKAQKVLDLGMTKMPIDKYGYYTLLRPFVTDYYKIGDPDKAREIFKKVAIIYQQWLRHYAEIPFEEQQQKQEDIRKNLIQYRSFVKIIKKQDDTDAAKKQVDTFNDYADKFAQVFGSVKGMKL